MSRGKKSNKRGKKIKVKGKENEKYNKRYKEKKRKEREKEKKKLDGKDEIDSSRLYVHSESYFYSVLSLLSRRQWNQDVSKRQKKMKRGFITIAIQKSPKQDNPTPTLTLSIPLVGRKIHHGLLFNCYCID